MAAAIQKKKSAPLLIGRSSRFRVVTQRRSLPPSSQLCLSLSGSLPLTEHRTGRRDEVDSEFIYFFYLNEKQAAARVQF